MILLYGPEKFMNKATLRRLERVLILTGVLCLGLWAWSWVDAKVYQYRENRLLEEASETDALASFQEAPSPASQERRPGPEGSLVGRIEIPRLDVSGIVLEGVDKTTLRRGVGRIPGTALPGTAGNVGLAAHRDSFFRGLKDIRKNDIVTLKTMESTYYYRVDWTEIVLPEDTHVLAGSGVPELTLVTCYPFYYVGSAPKRFIVRAQRIDESAALESLGKEGTGG